MTESQNNITLQHPLPYANRFLWVIKNFTEYHEDTTLMSPEFVFNVVDGVEEKLKFEITGRDSYNDFLLILHFQCEPFTERTFGINYSMVDKAGEVILNERKQVCEIKPANENSQRWLLIETDDLKDMIFKNDVIILVVNVIDNDIDKTIITDLLRSDQICSEKNNRPKIFKQFSDFYQMKELCDFKITVDNVEYPVHKFALAARSPVFATLFINEANSVRGNNMKISDASPQVVREMLNYVYTGTVNNIEELAKDLLVIGDKYNLDGLVELCTDHLRKKINVDNVFHVLAFATKYNVEVLKLATHLFFIGNTKKILHSETLNEIINSFAYSFDNKI